MRAPKIPSKKRQAEIQADLKAGKITLADALAQLGLVKSVRPSGTVRGQ